LLLITNLIGRLEEQKHRCLREGVGFLSIASPYALERVRPALPTAHNFVG
jgi:hypothetical protein